MEKKQLIKEIKKLSGKLNYFSETKSLINYYGCLLAATKQESKDHDRFRGSSIKRGISVYEESLYFAVKRVCEYVFSDQLLCAEHYNHTQKSCFIAYSWVWDHKEELRSLIPQDLALEIISSDYCKLIEV